MRKLVWIILGVLNRLMPKLDNVVLLYSGVEYKDNIKAVGDFLYGCHYDDRYYIFLGEYQRKGKSVLIAGEKKHIFGKMFSILIFLFAKRVFYAFNAIPIYPSKKQIVLQMWHGMPLKSIFNANATKLSRYDYFSFILATSPLYAKIMSESVPCSIDKVVIMGQPRTDAMLKNVLCNENKKIVFWAPTFRKAKYWNQKDAEMASYIPIVPNNQIDALSDALCGMGIHLVVKLHPMEMCDDSLVLHYGSIDVYSHEMFVKNGFELYDFLGKTDALITDYSSTYMDYLLLNRPIGFVLEDFDSYKSQRGFVFEDPFEYMPGEIISDYPNLLSFFESVAAGKDPFCKKREEINKLFNDYDTQKCNCKAVLDFMGIV